MIYSLIKLCFQNLSLIGGPRYKMVWTWELLRELRSPPQALRTIVVYDLSLCVSEFCLCFVYVAFTSTSFFSLKCPWNCSCRCYISTVNYIVSIHPADIMDYSFHLLFSNVHQHLKLNNWYLYQLQKSPWCTLICVFELSVDLSENSRKTVFCIQLHLLPCN